MIASVSSFIGDWFFFEEYRLILYFREIQFINGAVFFVLRYLVLFCNLFSLRLLNSSSEVLLSSFSDFLS